MNNQCPHCHQSLDRVERNLDPIERKVASVALRGVYEAERKQEGRNYAKEHSFEEWLQVP